MKGEAYCENEAIKKLKQKKYRRPVNEGKTMKYGSHQSSIERPSGTAFILFAGSIEMKRGEMAALR